MKKQAFTLAEVLITLAIIGVVAAITIPSVIVNTNQMEFKTGLRKAVSVLNQAITMNKALTGESPYDNGYLYEYLQQYMAIMKNNITITISGSRGYNNRTFYTTDGMRFEFPDSLANYKFRLYENSSINAKAPYEYSYYYEGNGNKVESYSTQCGSLGLANNPDSTTAPPCIIVVDVNGDRKPSPAHNYSYSLAGSSSGSAWDYYYDGEDIYKYANADGRLLTDIFSIMVTDTGAIPYGVVAQKAMYQAQK